MERFIVRLFFFLFAVFSLVAATPTAAANVAGDPCDEFGKTRLNDAQTEIIACLCPQDKPFGFGCVKKGEGTPVNTIWKGMSYQIPSGGCYGDKVLRFVNGAYRCARMEVFFSRFPVGEYLTGDEVCQRVDSTSRCVSQGYGVDSYAFCGTAFQDNGGDNHGVHCIRFVTELP